MKNLKIKHATVAGAGAQFQSDWTLIADRVVAYKLSDRAGGIVEFLIDSGQIVGFYTDDNEAIARHFQ